MSQSDIQEVEMNIKEAKKMVDMEKSLERLRNNEDFKKVILENYLDKEAVRLVHLKADSNMQSESSQKLVIQDIDAIGSFVQYLNTIHHQGDMARSAIDECELTLDELRSEGAEE